MPTINVPGPPGKADVSKVSPRDLTLTIQAMTGTGSLWITVGPGVTDDPSRVNARFDRKVVPGVTPLPLDIDILKNDGIVARVTAAMTVTWQTS